MSDSERIQQALAIAVKHGGTEEEHHQTWVVDQMVRALTGDGYKDWVADVKSGENGQDSYSWSTGIAP